MTEPKGLNHPNLAAVLDAWDKKNEMRDALDLPPDIVEEVDPYKKFANQAIEDLEKSYARVGLDDTDLFDESTALALFMASSIVRGAKDLDPMTVLNISLGLGAIASELGSRVRKMTTMGQLTLDEKALEELTKGSDGPEETKS